MVRFEESGDTVKVIGAKSTPEGIRAEHEYIAARLGEEGRDWKLVLQLLLDKEGVRCDQLEVELASGQRQTFLFDISEFFGIEVESGLIDLPPKTRTGCLGGVLAALALAALGRLRG